MIGLLPTSKWTKIHCAQPRSVLLGPPLFQVAKALERLRAATLAAIASSRHDVQEPVNEASEDESTAETDKQAAAEGRKAFDSMESLAMARAAAAVWTNKDSTGASSRSSSAAS